MNDLFGIGLWAVFLLFWIWVAFFGGDRYMEDSWLGDVYFSRYQNVGRIEADGWRLLAWVNLLVTGGVLLLTRR